jgi:hypothetical protein
MIHAAASRFPASPSRYSTTRRTRVAATWIPPRNDYPPSQNGIEPHLNYYGGSHPATAPQSRMMSPRVSFVLARPRQGVVFSALHSSIATCQANHHQSKIVNWSIVPHCFLREQGGKKPVFDQHMWHAFGKMQPARPHIAPQESRESPFLGINQWRAGKASRHPACIAISNSKGNWGMPRRPQAAITHSCPSRSIPEGGVRGPVRRRTGAVRIKRPLWSLPRAAGQFAPSNVPSVSLRQIRVIRVPSLHLCPVLPSCAFVCFVVKALISLKS